MHAELPQINETGEFSNITVVESRIQSVIQATTTIYSFGQRILETTQTVYPQPSYPHRPDHPRRYMYHLDFAKSFFSVFFNGLSHLEEHERVVAMENLCVIQVLKCAEDAPDTVLAWQFSVGDSHVSVAQVNVIPHMA